jgi:hypothetical protein
MNTTNTQSLLSMIILSAPSMLAKCGSWLLSFKLLAGGVLGAIVARRFRVDQASIENKSHMYNQLRQYFKCRKNDLIHDGLAYSETTDTVYFFEEEINKIKENKDFFNLSKGERNKIFSLLREQKNIISLLEKSSIDMFNKTKGCLEDNFNNEDGKYKIKMLSKYSLITEGTKKIEHCSHISYITLADQNFEKNYNTQKNINLCFFCYLQKSPFQTKISRFALKLDTKEFLYTLHNEFIKLDSVKVYLKKKNKCLKNLNKFIKRLEAKTSNPVGFWSSIRTSITDILCFWR